MNPNRWTIVLLEDEKDQHIAKSVNSMRDLEIIQKVGNPDRGTNVCHYSKWDQQITKSAKSRSRLFCRISRLHIPIEVLLADFTIF